MTTTMLVLPLLAPLVAALLVAAFGWGRVTAAVTMLAALAVVASGILVMARNSGGASYTAARLLRGDAVAGVMLLVIGSVTTLAVWGSIGYLDGELTEGQTTPARARLYGALVNAFVASMVLVVVANNLGVVWVAIEATTVSTAFLVGHRRTRASLEATWKYVVICSVGITWRFSARCCCISRACTLHPGHTHSISMCCRHEPGSSTRA